jgi:hypothetical protein
MDTLRPPPPSRKQAVRSVPRVQRTWQEVLQAAGYPTTVITLDFETFFDTKSGYGLKNLTVTEYIAHPKFEILGLASDG